MEVVEALLELRADIRAKTKDGLSPFCIAAGNGRMDVAKVLLRRGASARERAPDGTTALHCAACWGHIDMVDFLLDLGADPNALGTGGQTPLHSAAILAVNYHALKERLQRAGADPSLRDDRGQTADALFSARLVDARPASLDSSSARNMMGAAEFTSRNATLPIRGALKSR